MTKQPKPLSRRLDLLKNTVIVFLTTYTAASMIGWLATALAVGSITCFYVSYRFGIVDQLRPVVHTALLKAKEDIIHGLIGDY